MRASAANYDTAYCDYKLTVTNAQIELNCPAGDTLSKVYNAIASAPSASANGVGSEPIKIEYSVDGGAWSEDVPTITNVDTLQVSVRASAANYDTATCAYTLTISPLDVIVTIVGNSKTVVYDGAEHDTLGYVWSANTTLYTVADFKFTGDSTVRGTTVGTYPMNLEENQFENLNPNFGNVTFNVTDGELLITPRENVVVTITKHSGTVAYDGEEHAVTGYDFDSNDPLYIENYMRFNGTETDSTAKGTDVGSYGMSFDDTFFENINENFKNVTFVVISIDSLVITPITVKVTITKHGLTEAYDGQEHSISGYDFESDNALYKREHLTFTGAVSDSIATGTEVGKYGMAFTKDAFRNDNPNFSEVTVTVEEDSLKITPIKVNVTITKHGLTEAYDGQEHSVSGYDFESDNALYKREHLTFTGAVNDSIATGTEVGKYGMAFTKDAFRNDNPNFSEVTVTVVEDSLVIMPIPVHVTITKHGSTVPYDGSLHTVSGYDFASDNNLFIRSDLKFIGEVGDSIASGTEVGKYGMAFTKDDFENLNSNFSNLIITIVETDSLEITPITVNVTITKHGLTHEYDKTEHSVSGYDFVSGSALYNREDLKFIGATSDSVATGIAVGKYGMTFTESDFENQNHNFKDVVITIVEDSLEITPASANVTITKIGLTAIYDGEPHFVRGYEFESDNELYKREFLRFIGTDDSYIAIGTDAGKYGMSFTSDDFENTNKNFTNVTVRVVEDSLVILPVDVVVTITGNSLTVDYDGKAHTVSGYAWSCDNALYNGKTDISFSGDSIMTQTEPGVYPFGLDASQFVNTNPNFAHVTFVVDSDGQLVINKLNVDCPDDSENLLVEACSAMTLGSLEDSLMKRGMMPSASYINSATQDTIELKPALVRCAVDGSDNWRNINLSSEVEYNKNLTIRWIYKADYSDKPKVDSCELTVILKDTTLPVFDCGGIDPEPFSSIIDGSCDIPYKQLTFNTYQADDNCDGKVTGVLSWTTNLEDSVKVNDRFKVGVPYELHWVFQDATGNKVTCVQSMSLISNVPPISNCDIRHKTIDKFVSGLCDLSAAEANIQAPAAYEVCTNEPAYGVGRRTSGRGMDDPYSVGRDTIVWTYTSEHTTGVSYCEQYVVVKSDLPPVANCDSLKDAVITKMIAGVCETSAASMAIQTPVAFDPCTKELLYGVGSRTSGRGMDDPYFVGHDTIIWTFTGEYTTGVTTCEQYVFVQSDLAPIVNCDSLKNAVITKVIAGACETSAASMDIQTPVALEACTNNPLQGVGRRTSGRAMDDPYFVGHDTIVWTFTGEYATGVTTCEQYIFLQSNLKPLFDCASLKDTVVYLAADQCATAEGQVILPTPAAKDACVDMNLIGLLNRNGLSPEASYPKGETVVDWTFTSPYSTASLTCPQRVIVKDTIAPTPDCDALDTVLAYITDHTTFQDHLLYDEVVAAGLTTPTWEDPCGDYIYVLGRFEDGSYYQHDYEMGEKTIVWTFTDESGNSATCRQVVQVLDSLEDSLHCPVRLNGTVYACLDEVPAPYGSYADLKYGGGWFSTENKLVMDSYTTTDRYEGDSCMMDIYRTYSMFDVRGREYTCVDVMTVKDTIAPIFSRYLKDTLLTCKDTIFDPATVFAIDNCEGEVKVTFTETNKRGSDPNEADYFSYDIERLYEAVDRCGNYTSMRQVLMIRDTTPPVITVANNWRDTSLPKSLKGCLYAVPDYTEEVLMMVEDDCSEPTSIRISQNPPAGTLIEISTNVWIYVKDASGNMDSVAKYLRVQMRHEIVSVTAPSRDTCVIQDQGLSLASQNIRYAEGMVAYERANGTIRMLPSTFCYDYYRGDVSPENIIYSDNPRTYASQFADVTSMYTSAFEAAAELTKLYHYNQSGYYSFVVMDTTTGCSDTTTAYINLLERPKVNLNVVSVPVCEGMEIDLDQYVRCVDDMGSDITDHYWLVDGQVVRTGDTLMASSALNGKAAVYYAENQCGSTTSIDSHVMLSCDDKSLTTEDSLFYLDGDASALDMLRLNDLYANDSLVFDVHQRMNPDEIAIVATPGDPARVWLGESVRLDVRTNQPYRYLVWKKVVRNYDMRDYDDRKNGGFIFNDPEEKEDEIIDYSGRSYYVDTPQDTTFYYATLSDGICPETSTPVMEVDVLDHIPTAFTPFDKEGLNDVFMEGHEVIIFDRFGNKVFEGPDGWRGTRLGKNVEPSVYFYDVKMRDGSWMKGTIEVVKF